MTSAYQGQTTLTIKAGKRVIRNGVPARQSRESIVTIRKTAPASRGKTRVFWKSNGYLASALV